MAKSFTVLGGFQENTPLFDDFTFGQSNTQEYIIERQ
jgi:hypothetical protein